MKYELIKTEDYLLVVSDEQIKEGDWIKWGDAVFRAGDTTYLPPIKKIIAYLPLKDLRISPFLKGVDLLPPLPQVDDALEKAELVFPYDIHRTDVATDECRKIYVLGYNKAKETYKYTEDDMINAFKLGERGIKYQDHFADVWEDFKKLLQQQPKLPIAFESQDEYRVKSGTIQEHKEGKAGYEYYEPKTITNSQGQTEWVGKYIYK